MAIYYYSTKIMTRSKGQSAVAAAAYRSGSLLYDDRTGTTHDYTRKQAVAYCEIFAPPEAPNWAFDRQQLWNQVEASELRKDSQVAREVQVALPIELSLQQQVQLLQSFVQEQYVGRGMIADMTVHLKDNNPHAHILLSTRVLHGEGFGQKNRDWNAKALLLEQRQAWATHCNRALERAGCADVKIDHRTLKEQGIVDRIPQIHLGSYVAALLKKSERTGSEISHPRLDRFREIQQFNLHVQAELRALRQAIVHEEQRIEQARQKAEADRIAREIAEAARIAQEQQQAEAARIAQEQAEADRIAKEKAEAARIAHAQAEANRIAQQKAEADRIKQEQAEEQRQRDKQQTKPLQIPQAQAERQRIAHAKEQTEVVQIPQPDRQQGSPKQPLEPQTAKPQQIDAAKQQKLPLQPQAVKPQQTDAAKQQQKPPLQPQTPKPQQIDSAKQQQQKPPLQPQTAEPQAAKPQQIDAAKQQQLAEQKRQLKAQQQHWAEQITNIGAKLWSQSKQELTTSNGYTIRFDRQTTTLTVSDRQGVLVTYNHDGKNDIFTPAARLEHRHLQELKQVEPAIDAKARPGRKTHSRKLNKSRDEGR